MSLAEKLIEVGKELEETARREAGSTWAGVLRKLISLREKPSAQPKDTLQWLLVELGEMRTLKNAADLFLAERWLAAVSARMSYSYIQQLRVKQKEILRLLGEQERTLQEKAIQAFLADEDHDDILQRGMEFLGRSERLSAEDTQEFNPPLFRALLHLVENSSQLSNEKRAQMLQSMRAMVLRVVESRCEPGQETADSVHPIIKMGLSYGLVPDRQLVLRGSEDQLLRAALPGSRAVLYDLQALLRGVGGTIMSGVSFSLAQELETIRYLDPSGPRKMQPHLDASHMHRLDFVEPLASLGSVRRIEHGDKPRDLDQYLRGPSLSLAAYHRLTEAVLSDEAEGCALSNLDRVMEIFESGSTPLSGEELKRESREFAYLKRKIEDREPDPKTVREGAESIAEDLALKRHEVMQRRLTTALMPNAMPGSETCRQRELDMSAIMQCRRLQRGLTKVMGYKSKSGRREALEGLLASEGASSASLKMTALVLGRPGGLR